MILPLFIYVFAFVLLVACWIWGDLEFQTKAILTGIYVATWLLALVSPWFVVATQALLSLVMWAMTFMPTGR